MVTLGALLQALDYVVACALDRKVGHGWYQNGSVLVPM
jgi:hypothetical protein